MYNIIRDEGFLLHMNSDTLHVCTPYCDIRNADRFDRRLVRRLEHLIKIVNTSQNIY